MISVLTINIFAVFFAWLESYKISKIGLKLSIFTIFLFLAFRYNFGNDYMYYLDNFNSINSLPLFNADSYKIKGYEIGWLYLNRIFGLLGFFAMQIVLAAFSCYVLFRFIRKYMHPKYYWFAIFLYMFQPYNMLVFSSAMRQSVAIFLFLLAIDFIIQKKVLKYLVIILIATLFHTSAFFLFPFILLGFVNWHIKFIHIVIAFVLFLLPIIYSQPLVDYVTLITSQYLTDYDSYTKEVDTTIDVGLGFALNFIVYLVVIYYSQYETNTEKKLLFKLAIISFLMIPITFGIHMISRFNFYLLPLMMAVFPFVFAKIKRIKTRMIYIGIVVLFTLYQFYVFFQSDVWGKHFGEYHTIFSSPVFY